MPEFTKLDTAVFKQNKIMTNLNSYNMFMLQTLMFVEYKLFND